jgi:hypothetical protein
MESLYHRSCLPPELLAGSAEDFFLEGERDERDGEEIIQVGVR